MSKYICDKCLKFTGETDIECYTIGFFSAKCEMCGKNFRMNEGRCISDASYEAIIVRYRQKLIDPDYVALREWFEDSIQREIF